MRDGRQQQARRPANRQENDKAARQADARASDLAATTDQAAGAATRDQAAGKQDQPQQQSAKGRMTNQERDMARARLGVDDPEAAGNAPSRSGPARVVAVDELDGMTVFNARGERLGEVDEVVADANGRHYVVIEQGGFLGIGDDEVAFPIERFWLKGDALVIRNVSENDLDAMDDYRSAAENYRQVSDNASAQLRVWQ
jgi:sporulation protein YlmC with PRC-barrel domain